MISSEKLDALAMAEGLAPTPANLVRLSKNVGETAARWAFTQWELRKKGQAKFVRAHEMLFTREALEQATHESVANYHAHVLADAPRPADLTTGIGADLIALAPATGYELDEERAECARHNVSVHGKEAEVVVGDSLSSKWSFDFAYADPARRVEGRRTLHLIEFEPNPMELAQRMAALELGCIKLTPMLADSALEGLGPRLEFISFGGECREALVITGRQAAAGRWAVHVESGARLSISHPHLSAAGAGGGPEAFLYEADPAAIRAHALDALADEYGLSFLGDSNGYLTADKEVDSVWLKRYEVLYSGKADLATTKRELRRLGAAKPILKQRGANQDLARLGHAFKAEGTLPVALAIWAVGKSLRHTIVKLPT